MNGGRVLLAFACLAAAAYAVFRYEASGSGRKLEDTKVDRSGSQSSPPLASRKPSAPAQSAPDQSGTMQAARPVASTVFAPQTPTKEAFEQWVAGTRDPTTHALHQKFASEPVDPVWSANVESSLASYFAAQPAAQNLTVVSMECHSSICEILAVPTANSPDQWQASISAATQETWWSGYGFKDMSVGISMDGERHAFVTAFLTTNRIEPDAGGADAR